MVRLFVTEKTFDFFGCSINKAAGECKCENPAFPNVSGSFKKLGVKDSLEFSGKVLEEAKVAVVPGSAFGCDENVRLSFATSMDNIREGLDRLEKLLGKA